jgi:hypothetical protein
VVVALIVIGVIAFLAIDAYVIYRVFKSRAAADDYGRFPIPGEATVTLPAGGKLKVSYQEEFKASGDENTIDFGVPETLRVEVKGPAGEALEIKGPGFRGMGESVNTGSDWSRASTRSRPGRSSKASSRRSSWASRRQLPSGRSG